MAELGGFAIFEVAWRLLAEIGAEAIVQRLVKLLEVNAF